MRSVRLVALGALLLAGNAAALVEVRVDTLEDIYQETGNSFQGAIGFLTFEGTSVNPSKASYGLAVDDVVLRWNEIELIEDETDCVNGSCASLDIDVAFVFEGQAVLGINLLEPSPPAVNDCYKDGDTTDVGYCSETLPGAIGGGFHYPFLKTCTVHGDCTGTCVAHTRFADDTDCNDSGNPDLVVRATSTAEITGEVVWLERSPVVGREYEYKGTLPVSNLGDSPGTLFIVGPGPGVTVRYLDENDGTGSACPNDVDPANWGVITAVVQVLPGTTCGLGVAGATITDNGDHDSFPDTDETIDMRVKFVNNCYADLNNCTARISSESGQVDCILVPVVALGEIDEGVVVTSPSFVWKVANISRTDPDDDEFNAVFQVTVTCDEIDGTSAAQEISLAVDLDITDGGQTPVAWSDGFELGFHPTASPPGSGKFKPENLDVGIPGANNFEGLQNGDGYRCQYHDPDWEMSLQSGDPSGLDCYPGFSLAQANDVWWQVDMDTASANHEHRAKSGSRSAYYGAYLTSPAGQFSTPMGVIESISTPDQVNLGAASPELAFWHQVSLVDNRSIVNIPVGFSEGRAIVMLRSHESNGAPITDWLKIEPFQNVHDQTTLIGFFNCFFDPVDDGNDEDDFFDPSNPFRQTGPSSTCVPERHFAYLGDTDEPFGTGVIHMGNATTAPLASDSPSVGLGTWVQSRFDLSEFRGRRVKLRFLATDGKGNGETWEDGYGLNTPPEPGDDGWWIDDVTINQTLPNPATFAIDDNTVGHCTADLDFGCVTNANCTESRCVGGLNHGKLCPPASCTSGLCTPGPGGTCTAGPPGCGAGCVSVDVVIATEPDETPGALVEALVAPGQPILIDASASSAICPTLQYQFKNGSTVVRPYSENPVYIDGPSASATTYTVDVRCPTEPSCTGQATVHVSTVCPDAGNAPPFHDEFPGVGDFDGIHDAAEQILATSKTTFGWSGLSNVLVWKGPISGFGTPSPVAPYSPPIAPFDPLSLSNANQFADPATPSSGAGFFYMVRDTQYCNDPWTTQSSKESQTPGRDGAGQICVGGPDHGNACTASVAASCDAPGVCQLTPP